MSKREDQKVRVQTGKLCSAMILKTKNPEISSQGSVGKIPHLRDERWCYATCLYINAG
jgi:hypothetical protein